MMKRLIPAALAAMLASAAHAAPTLTADPYPSTGVQPDSASVTINGGAPVACTLVTNAQGGKVPTCDLASIASAGTYTLVLTVTKAASCTSGTNSADCTAGGSASSPPFSYRLVGGSVAAPVLRVVP